MNNLKITLLLLPVLLFGCRSNQGPSANYYYRSPHKNLNTIGRAILLELCNDSAYPQISIDVTEVLYQEFQKKQVFGLTVINKDDPVWQSLQLDLILQSEQLSQYHEEWGLTQPQNSSAESQITQSFKHLSTIRKTQKCDAILFGSITNFEPYPHMAIGLKLMLIDLTNSQVLWALEQIWDTADRKTEDRIRNFYKQRLSPGYMTLREKLGTVSSFMFIKFVASEVAETLQPQAPHRNNFGFIGRKLNQLGLYSR